MKDSKNNNLLLLSNKINENKSIYVLNKGLV